MSRFGADESGEVLAVDAPGIDTTTLLLRKDGLESHEFPRHSVSPSVPTSVVFPLVVGDEFTAGDAALTLAYGSGEAWPPLSRLKRLDNRNVEPDDHDFAPQTMSRPPLESIGDRILKEPEATAKDGALLQSAKTALNSVSQCDPEPGTMDLLRKLCALKLPGTNPQEHPIQSAAKKATSRCSEPRVLQGRLPILRCWDALRDSLFARHEFSWRRPDDLPEAGSASAGRGIGLEVAASVMRYPDASVNRLIVSIPDWLDDLGQQQLLDGVVQETSLAPNCVRLLWRPVSIALAWLEGLSAEAEPPHGLTVVYAGFGGLEVSTLGVRSEIVTRRRVLCPVRSGSPSLPPLGSYVNGLIECGREALPVAQQLASDQTLASRIMRGKVHFVRGEKSGEEGELEPDFDSGEHHFRRLAHLAARSWKRLEASASELARGLGRDGRTQVLLFGPVATIVEATLRRIGVSVKVVDEDFAARGGIVFADRLRKGLPTYYDRLPSLSLFVLMNHERHWEDLIPEGTEVDGDRPFKKVFRRLVKVVKDQGHQSLDSYLRREGDPQLRFLKTSLEEVGPGDEECDLVVEARSAGGVARIRAIPTTKKELFGKSGELLLDWGGMEKVAPIADGWPPVTVRFGWPRCGEIYSARTLFENLLAMLEEANEMLAGHQWSRALATLEAALQAGGAAKSSRPLLDADPEVQQMSPIGALRPVGTSSPALYLDPARKGGPWKIPDSLHERMKAAARSLSGYHDVLRSGEGPSRAELARRLESAAYKVLSWLGSYMPAEIAGVLQEEVESSPNNENLTAYGRCMRDADSAAYLTSALVTRKLQLDPRYLRQPASVAQAVRQGKGTTNFLSCFVYLAFQHPDILQRCDREQVCVLAWHASSVVADQVADEKFARKFVVALRSVALSLRYRRFCPGDDPFLRLKHAIIP